MLLSNFVIEIMRIMKNKKVELDFRRNTHQEFDREMSANIFWKTLLDVTLILLSRFFHALRLKVISFCAILLSFYFLLGKGNHRCELNITTEPRNYSMCVHACRIYLELVVFSTPEA